MADTQSRVLMVDDDPGICRVVTRALQTAGLEVVAVPNRASAVRQLEGHGPFALIILDVNLPDASGLDLCHELIAAYRVPVLMLTAVVDASDIVRALESGADDYVRKPFDTRELVARVQSVLRRARRDEPVQAQKVEAGPIQLDPENYRAAVNGEPLPLTPTEYRLLVMLVQHRGRVITHDELLTSVWGPGYEGENHMLHVTMSRLRQKLSKLAGEGVAVRTMAGVGYEFIAGE